MTERLHLTGLDHFIFGDGPEMANRLLSLVIAGTKTATCGKAKDAEPVLVGSQSVIHDGSGQPRAVIETLEVRLCRFCDVDEAFARDEGEGDLSLAWWRKAHSTFFERSDGFSDTMELWCERFRLVQVLPSAEPVIP